MDMSNEDAELLVNWCWRVSRWLRLHQAGAMTVANTTLQDLIYVLEDEAVQGERLAALLDPGPVRAAASRIVARLDSIIVDLSNQLLTEAGHEATGSSGNGSRGGKFGLKRSSPMTKHLPPIPPENVSPKGTGGENHLDPKNASTAQMKAQRAERNFAEQGRQGNIKQNTTNQGLQQDR